MEFKFDDPIFAIYVNISNLSRQKAEEKMSSVVESTRFLGNVIYLSSKIEDKIELLWPGNGNINLSNDHINNVIDVLESSLSLLQDKWENINDVKNGIFQIRKSLRNLKISEIL